MRTPASAGARVLAWPGERSKRTRHVIGRVPAGSKPPQLDGDASSEESEPPTFESVVASRPSRESAELHGGRSGCRAIVPVVLRLSGESGFRSRSAATIRRSRARKLDTEMLDRAPIDQPSPSDVAHNDSGS